MCFKKMLSVVVLMLIALAVNAQMSNLPAGMDVPLVNWTMVLLTIAIIIGRRIVPAYNI